MRRTLILALVAVTLLLTACGGAEPPAATPDWPATHTAFAEEVEAQENQLATKQAEVDNGFAQLTEQAAQLEEAAEPAEVSPTAQPTAKPTATAVPPTASAEPVISGYANPVSLFEWGSANVQEGVTTIKVNTTGGCTMPEVVCYMLDNAGVLGADDLAEAEANPSAIWLGSADHQTAQTPTVGALIPEGSYLTAYADSFAIDGGGYSLQFESCGPHCAWGFLARGWFAETRVDRHIPITISDYGAVGAMKYTRYPVPVEAGQFFSQDYLTAQAENALDFDNCGIGNEDCDVFMQAIFDYNDGSLTILRFTAERDWELVWTNIVGHGR